MAFGRNTPRRQQMALEGQSRRCLHERLRDLRNLKRVAYGGNTLQAVDRNVIYGYHGEFFRGQGQAGQTMHFYDDGLFVGQFGEANPGHYAYEGALPGFAGNGHSPSLIKTSTGDYYLWVNDESDTACNAGTWSTQEISASRLEWRSWRCHHIDQPALRFPPASQARAATNPWNCHGLPVQARPATTSTIPHKRRSLQYPRGTTTSLDYVVGGLINGQTCYFAVTAVQAGVEGTPSEQVRSPLLTPARTSWQRDP